MKTKEEILKEEEETNTGGGKSYAYAAMERLAAQQAIDFARWLPENGYIAGDDYYWISFRTWKQVSEVDLYSLYLEERKQPK